MDVADVEEAMWRLANLIDEVYNADEFWDWYETVQDEAYQRGREDALAKL